MSRIIIIITGLLCIIAVLSLTVCKEKIKAVFYIDHMERDERTRRMNIDRIVESLEIKPGDIIADIGAGSGLFSREFSQKVIPGGIVYAVDINKKLLDHIEKKNSEDGITNIKIQQASEDDPRIPQPVDLIFICDTLHYIENQEQYVKKMSGYLKKNGSIAVVSFKTNWPPMSIEFTGNDLERWMKNAGLELSDNYDFIQDEYLMIFRKAGL